MREPGASKNSLSIWTLLSWSGPWMGAGSPGLLSRSSVMEAFLGLVAVFVPLYAAEWRRFGHEGPEWGCAYDVRRRGCREH